MPNKIKPKRSYTANSVPLTTDLEVNELAIRWTADSPAIFTKNASGQIVTVALGGSSGGGGGGSSSLVTAATVAGFPATGSTANLYVATDSNRIYRWDSANSIYVELGPLASSGDTLLRSYLVPTAPTNVVATAGNAQVALSWTAASSLSQIPITDYLIQSSTDNGTTWALASDTVSTATSATITGLTNGTAYTFRVAAVNGVGTGAYSAASTAVTPTAIDITSSLLGYWPFNSNANDASGNGYNLTSTGSPTSATGKLGNGINTTSGYYYYSTNAPFNPTTQYSVTVNVWAKSTTNSGRPHIVSTQPEASPYNGWSMACDSAWQGDKMFVFRNTGTLLISTSSIFDGAWHMFTYVENRESQIAQLWVDGVKEHEISTGGVSVGGQESTLTVGWRAGLNNSAWRGDIDELAIWSRALTQTQIQYLYNSGSGRAVIA